MRNIFKTALLWLLLLAVPFQGYAASAMLFCDTSHHRTVTTQTIDDHQHSHGQHAMHHGSLASADHHHDVSSGDFDHGSGKPGSKHGLSKCSACSTCCVGAAIVPTTTDFVAPPPASFHQNSFTALFFIGHIAGRLERPPSTLIA